MNQQDTVNEVNGVDTNTSRYGVFYPVDGLLQGGYDTYEDAREDAVAYEAMDSYLYKDAYVVRVTIEKVED